MSTFDFNGEKYKLASTHQKEWGQDLMEKISFTGDESILDLGCGEGVLTEKLSRFVPKGKVIGIDASASMIKTAKTIHKCNLEFLYMDINKMPFENEFTVIFSNAALHWIIDHKSLLQNTFNALKPGGVIAWDFGGEGNCANFFDVVRKKLMDPIYAPYFKDFTWPWFTPSKSQYEDLISIVHFTKHIITEVNRDRFFQTSEEISKWIDQPCLVPFLKCLPQTLKERFRQEAIDEMLQRTKQPDGTYFETFRRIQVFAQK